MRTRQTMTISLPPEMIQKVELVRKAEHRTRSELVREALRTYFVRARPYEPTAAERREIEKGRTAVKRGDYYSMDEFRGAVGGPDKKGRLKGRSARSKA
jgi:Arc/MetJ-type ribon-helix-helix transcriptional regulator